MYFLFQTPEEFLAQYEAFVGGREQMLTLTAYQEAPNGYDGVWAIALALEETNNRLKERCKYYILSRLYIYYIYCPSISEGS